MFSFGLGVVSFVSALCCFMVETMMATQLLNFHPLRQPATIPCMAAAQAAATAPSAAPRKVVAEPGRQDAFMPQV